MMTPLCALHKLVLEASGFDYEIRNISYNWFINCDRIHNVFLKHFLSVSCGILHTPPGLPHSTTNCNLFLDNLNNTEVTSTFRQHPNLFTGRQLARTPQLWPFIQSEISIFNSYKTGKHRSRLIKVEENSIVLIFISSNEICF